MLKLLTHLNNEIENVNEYYADIVGLYNEEEKLNKLLKKKK